MSASPETVTSTVVRNAVNDKFSREKRNQYLTFTLGEEMFGVDIDGVKEIIGYGGVTAVPMTPAFIRGVINLRGKVVPAIDLAARFGRESVPVGKRTCIVIVEMSSPGEDDDVRGVLGIVVDRVSEVVRIDDDDIEPAPDFGARVRADFIAAIAKLAGQFVILLDIAHVLEIEEMAELAKLRPEDGGVDLPVTEDAASATAPSVAAAAGVN